MRQRFMAAPGSLFVNLMLVQQLILAARVYSCAGRWINTQPAAKNQHSRRLQSNPCRKNYGWGGKTGCLLQHQMTAKPPAGAFQPFGQCQGEKECSSPISRNVQLVSIRKCI